MLFTSIHQVDVPFGSRVLVRACLNVPIQDGEVADSLRLRQTARTINFLKQRGGRVVVIGHLGRDGNSLAPVHRELNKIESISFVPHIVGEVAYASRKRLRPGDALLLENTRSDPREEQNDPLFAEELGAETDMFVYDDFSAAHREHASTTGLINTLPSYGGILFYEELTALVRLTERMVPPAFAIVGGAKCKTKIPLIAHLLDSYEAVFVGGVVANTLLKQRGFAVGKSKVEDFPVPEQVLSAKNVILPRDVVVGERPHRVRIALSSEVGPNDVIVDVGDKTLKEMQYRLENAKTVLMNGPLGLCEQGFCERTAALSQIINKTHAYSFIGGGDTIAALNHNHLLDGWNFVSTGGGSMLTYLAKRSLPVLDALAAQGKDGGSQQGTPSQGLGVKTAVA